IGCGMMAVKTSLSASHLPDNLHALRMAIEKAVPHGMHRKRNGRDTGSWKDIPEKVLSLWAGMEPRYHALIDKHPKLAQGNDVNQMGTLGSGNHFIEICL